MFLIVFRTNTSYKRWDEARKNWGMNINHTRDLVRMASAYYDRSGRTDEQRQEDLKQVALATWSFVRSMKRHLSPEQEDEEDFKRELYERLPAAQADCIINAAHRPNRALYDLSMTIECVVVALALCTVATFGDVLESCYGDSRCVLFEFVLVWH